MNITKIGIDLAKSVFQLHGIDSSGKVLIKKQIKRAQMAEYFVSLRPCLVGMETCGSAHHWARKLESFGHMVKLMPPQMVVVQTRSKAFGHQETRRCSGS